MLSRGTSRVQSTQRSTSRNQKSTQVAELFNLIGGDLSTSEKTSLAEPLDEFSGVFAKDRGDLGRTDKVLHRNPTGDAASIKQRPRRLPMHQREEVETSLCKKHVIQTHCPGNRKSGEVQRRNATEITEMN